MAYGKKLSDEEIRVRMVELRNLRQAHKRDQRIKAHLRSEVKELRQLVVAQQEQLNKQAIQIAELQTMVFGKKRKPPTGHHAPSKPIIPAKLRSKDSYRRPIPPASAVTAERKIPLPDTCTCGGNFNPAKTTIHERYEEDIPLPELTENYRAHLVTKYSIVASASRAVKLKPVIALKPTNPGISADST